jgi:hypothetical protein
MSFEGGTQMMIRFQMELPADLSSIFVLEMDFVKKMQRALVTSQTVELTQIGRTSLVGEVKHAMLSVLVARTQSAA